MPFYRRRHPAATQTIVTVIPPSTSSATSSSAVSGWSDTTSASAIMPSDAATSRKRRRTLALTAHHIAAAPLRHRRLPLTERLFEDAKRRAAYLSALQPAFPFAVDWAQRDAADGSLQCFLIGVQTDPRLHTLRKSNGLVVLLTLATTAPQRTLRHIESTNISVLCTLFQRYYAGELTRADLSAFMCRDDGAVEKRSVQSLIGRYTTSGLSRFTYVSLTGQRCTLEDVFPRPIRVKTERFAPQLTLLKRITPRRNTNALRDVDAAQMNNDATEVTRGQHDDTDDDESSPPQRRTALSADAHRRIRQRTTVMPQSALPSSVSTHSIFAPPPFPAQEHVVVYWSAESQSAAQSLFAQLTSLCPSVAAYPLDDPSMIETIVKAIGINVVQALTAPLIPSALTLNDKIQRIRKLIPQTTHSAPAALRLDDTCAVIVTRSMFDTAVWPHIPHDTMFELNDKTPTMSVEDDNDESNTERSRAHESLDLSVALVARQVRLFCPKTHFELFTLNGGATSPSLYYSAHVCLSLYSLPMGSELTAPVFIEWPNTAFSAAIIVHWCAHWIRVPADAAPLTVLIAVSLQYCSHKHRRDIVADIDAESAAVRSKSPRSNHISVGRICITARPHDDFTLRGRIHFLLIELRVRHTLANDNSPPPLSPAHKPQQRNDAGRYE